LGCFWLIKHQIYGVSYIEKTHIILSFWSPVFGIEIIIRVGGRKGAKRGFKKGADIT
jgi:hypothetical protein